MISLGASLNFSRSGENELAMFPLPLGEGAAKRRVRAKPSTLIRPFGPPSPKGRRKYTSAQAPFDRTCNPCLRVIVSYISYIRSREESNV